MKGLRNRGSAAVVASALLVFPLSPARAAVVAPTTAREAAPAAVVGLDADAPAQGAALTRAMRRAFAARGLSGGEEVNLSELRLALGCKGTSPECLTKGGERLGARRLIYGTLQQEGDGWLLEATLLEVEGGAVTSTRMPLTHADLEADRIDATAEAIASRLAPDVAVSSAPAQGSGELATPPPPPPPEPEPAAEPAAEPESAEARKGRLQFGWERPQPKWKLVGFGVSAGMLLVSGSATLGMGLWLNSQNGGFRGKLLETAEASLTDDNELNDVDPSLPQSVSLCEFAQTRPTDANGNPIGEEGQVRNASVAKVCSDGDTIRTAQIGTGITAAISGASTVVFMLLLLVHRKPAPESAWQRHRLQVGVDPAREGGLTLRVGGRF